MNDAWLIADIPSAEEARNLLNQASMSGTPTSDVVALLDQIIANSPNSIYLAGTYPHDEWQGSRIEGFVVAEGDQISRELLQDLQVDDSHPNLVCHGRFARKILIIRIRFASSAIVSSFLLWTILQLI